MYIGWLETDPKPESSAGEVAMLEREYHQLARAWHRFDLAGTDKAAAELLTAVEEAFDISSRRIASEEHK